MGKAVLIVALFALLVYGVLVLLERHRGRRSNRRGPGRTPPSTTRRSLAPDDDPDFLRDLERKRRREQRDNPE